MSVRKQVRTRSVSTRSIVASSEFARGLEEVRNGRPFNPDNNNWDYERGRCFGFIAPLDLPLRIGTKLNPKALELAEAAFNRKLLSYEKGKKDQGATAPLRTRSDRHAIAQDASPRHDQHHRERQAPTPKP